MPSNDLLKTIKIMLEGINPNNIHNLFSVLKVIVAYLEQQEDQISVDIVKLLTAEVIKQKEREKIAQAFTDHLESTNTDIKVDKQKNPKKILYKELTNYIKDFQRPFCHNNIKLCKFNIQEIIRKKPTCILFDKYLDGEYGVITRCPQCLEMFNE